MIARIKIIRIMINRNVITIINTKKKYCILL